MPVQILTPQEIQELFKTNPTAVYIDVRTVGEFAAGHPRGKVVNIPFVFLHPTTKETYPNNSFLEVVESLYAKDTSLIVGGDDGERTKQAATQITQMGYTDVSIMPDGHASWRAWKPADNDG